MKFTSSGHKIENWREKVTLVSWPESSDSWKEMERLKGGEKRMIEYCDKGS